MPTSVGPNTFGEGNLVFGYDTGDTANSYRGEPTENLATLDLGNTSVWYNEDAATTTKELQSETLFGYPVYKFASRPGSIWITPFAFNGYDKANGPITVSAYIRNMGAVATVSTYLSGDYSTDSLGSPNYKTIPTDGVWRRYSWTRTSADMNTANQLEFRTSGDNMQISCPQVEHKLHPTPIVDGTRSATQGLVDLTGNSTIDLTDVSFDSDAQMTFDGSNDYIQLTGDILNVDSFTIEAVVNITSVGNYNKPIFVAGDLSSAGIWFFKHRSGLGNRLVMHGYDGVNPRIDVDSVNQVPDAQDTYVAVTFDGNAYQLYMNGEPEDSAVVDNKVGATTTNYIGKQGGTYLDGDIPMMKIYTRGLSAKEIKANYNAIKGRFNI